MLPFSPDGIFHKELYSLNLTYVPWTCLLTFNYVAKYTPYDHRVCVDLEMQYIYAYTQYIYIYKIYICLYIYIEREREREIDRRMYIYIYIPFLNFDINLSIFSLFFCFYFILFYFILVCSAVYSQIYTEVTCKKSVLCLTASYALLVKTQKCAKMWNLKNILKMK